MLKPIYRNWQSWLQSPLGQYAITWEQTQLDQNVSDIFGYYALQIGMPELYGLKENRMSVKVLALNQDELTRCQTKQTSSVVIYDIHHLPFADESIDLVLLPHTLEFAQNPHHLLREAYRILAPEGKLILTGFNSLSLWGLKQTFSKVLKHPFIPEIAHSLAFIRVKDWLKLLNFELESGRFGCYCPPFKTEKWLKRYAFMESAGDRWWPIFGALYTITAIKRIHTLSFVGPIKFKKPRIKRALNIQPSVQSEQEMNL